MKRGNSFESFKPFQGLDALLKRKSFVLSSPGLRGSKGLVHDPEADLRMFREAMADVKPLTGRNHHIETNAPVPIGRSTPESSDIETMRQLNCLVRCGKGLNLSDTPEYMEGAGYRVHPGVARKLHEGFFSVQAHLDLHGMSVYGAREALNTFLIRAVRKNQRAVLIIHGRGLSSPLMPVLKSKVEEWLSRSAWRKWVLAFSSARGCDGGTGATYVLLRQRPATRRLRKSAASSRTDGCKN